MNTSSLKMSYNKLTFTIVCLMIHKYTTVFNNLNNIFIFEVFQNDRLYALIE